MVLLAVLVAVLGTWAFIMLADAVKEKGTQNIDERIIIALRRPENRAIPIGPAWLHEVGRDMTALGGVAVLSGNEDIANARLEFAGGCEQDSQRRYDRDRGVHSATGHGPILWEGAGGAQARERPVCCRQ